MGLTTWRNAPDGKILETDVTIAKNYLSQEEITELNPDDMDDNDIIVDLEEEKELDESADEQIVKDVDKVFTTRKDDDISDSDLDFIDELNSDEDGVLEEIQDLLQNAYIGNANRIVYQIPKE